MLEHTVDSPEELFATTGTSYIPYTTMPLVTENQYETVNLKICEGVTTEFSTCNSLTTGDTFLALMTHPTR